MKLLRGLALVIGLSVSLTACDQVSSATDKASACSQALGLANLNPNVDPNQLASEAGQKADQLRQLADKVSDQDLKQNLITIADSYVALEKRKANDLGNINDWVQANADNISKLRAACL
ncbi:MAG TPA: hypothetical protein VFG87_01255 [Amycolatopsis sp.]|nr:hypothetical protein [Amycolatopsis sp.]